MIVHKSDLRFIYNGLIVFIVALLNLTANGAGTGSLISMELTTVATHIPKGQSID